MAALTQRVQLRRDTTANWTTNASVILAAGEVGVELIAPGNIKAKVGDGVTAWSLLPYIGSNVGGGNLVDNANGTYTFTPVSGPAITFGMASADANNGISVGSDQRPFLAKATTAPPAVSTSGSAVGTSTAFALADHTHAETLTTFVYNPATKTLTYTDEAGIAFPVDLSALALDLNVTGATVNGDNLELTVTDGTTTNTVTVSMAQFRISTVGGSVTGDGNLAPLTLVNDNAAPGNDYQYATDGTGTKGWFPKPAIPAAGGAPANLSATAAAAGTSTAFAREDHVHLAPTLLGLQSAGVAPVVESLVTVNASGVQAYYDGIDGGAAATFP